jgi:hypothetical protein
MTPEEFIDENYFSLTIDCKREINEIYQALKDYAKIEQLTLTDVVRQSEQFNCGKERVYGEERCKLQCDMCDVEYNDN